MPPTWISHASVLWMMCPVRLSSARTGSDIRASFRELMDINSQPLSGPNVFGLSFLQYCLQMPRNASKV